MATSEIKQKIVRIKYTREFEFAIPAAEMPEPVQRQRLHVAVMGCGGDTPDKPGRVIDAGKVCAYTGIGWIAVKDCADAADYRRFPRVID